MNKGDKSNNKKFTIEILGEEFTITGNLSGKTVNELQELVNEIGQDINSAYPRLPRRRLWGLSIINMAYKYYKLKEKYQKILENHEEMEKENKILEQKVKTLRADNEELSELLEEVDD